MPHHVSPPEQPTMIVKPSDAAAPLQTEVTALLNAIFDAKTSKESVDGAYALCDLVLNSPLGFRALTECGILAEIKKAATNKKLAEKREGAQNLLGALFERFPPKQQ